MKTYSFIGSDKNAGKTTALNFVYRRCYQKKSAYPQICLTSIGINGEAVDGYENKEKPAIQIFKNTMFITAGEHLRGLEGQTCIRHVFSGPNFPKPYVLAQALTDFPVILEGPNTKTAIQAMKIVISRQANDITCFIDGSIDRQFLGHPVISDGICFALLLTSRPEQLAKATDLLAAMMLKPCSLEIKRLIDAHANQHFKSLLIGLKGEIIHKGSEPPFLDNALKEACFKHREEPCILYLNGSLTQSMVDSYAPLENLTVILDSFTCYQAVSVIPGQDKKFQPGLSCYHTVPLSCLFIKQAAANVRIDLPPQLPVFNLFRDDPHEIGI